MCGAQSIWVPRHPRTRLSSRVDPTNRPVPCPQTIGWNKAGRGCVFWDIQTKILDIYFYINSTWRRDSSRDLISFPLTSELFQGPWEAAAQSLGKTGLTCMSIDARTMSNVSFFHAPCTATRKGLPKTRYFYIAFLFRVYYPITPICDYRAMYMKPRNISNVSFRSIGRRIGGQPFKPPLQESCFLP